LSEGERPWSRVQRKAMFCDPQPGPKPLWSVLADSAARHPGSPCIYYNGAVLTYAEVDRLSSRFASALGTLGVKKGDRVAVFLPNTPQFVIAFFGILKAGGVVTACNPLYKERELEHQLADSGAGVVVAARDVVDGSDLYQSLAACRPRLGVKHVVTTSVADYLPPLKRRLAGLAGVRAVKRPDTLDFQGLIRAHEADTAPTPVDPMADLAVLQYTGGTSGVSKGSMLTHFGVYSISLRATSFLPLTEKDVFLAVLPLFHVYGLVASLMIPMQVGAQVLLLPRFHVEDVMKTVQERKATMICAVPAMYAAIAGNPKAIRYDMSSVRICISGGASLPSSVRAGFMRVSGASLVEGYGLSETSALTHLNPLYEGGAREGSVGVPFPGTDVAVVDPDNPARPLQAGSVGEVAVQGPQVMVGYWNNPEESRAALRDGWLLTGDLGRMDDDGYLYIVDRKKDMVNVGGFKVYPRELEELLCSHPAVREAGVVAKPDAFSGEAVKAFVVLKEHGRAVTAAELVAYCEKNVARHKVPKEVVFVPELPKTLLGKVLRRKLREPTFGLPS